MAASSNEFSERVIDALRELSDESEPVSLDELVSLVTAPGECAQCNTSPVRRMVHKLIDEGDLYLSPHLG